MSKKQTRLTGPSGLTPKERALRKCAQARVDGKPATKARKWKCDVEGCRIEGKHRHCPECGSTKHSAAECDMEG